MFGVNAGEGRSVFKDLELAVQEKQFKLVLYSAEIDGDSGVNHARVLAASRDRGQANTFWLGRFLADGRKKTSRHQGTKTRSSTRSVNAVCCRLCASS